MASGRFATNKASAYSIFAVNRDVIEQIEAKVVPKVFLSFFYFFVSFNWIQRFLCKGVPADSSTVKAKAATLSTYKLKLSCSVAYT